MPFLCLAPWKRSKSFQQKYLLDAIRKGNLKQLQHYYVSLQKYNYRLQEDSFFDPSGEEAVRNRAEWKGEVVDVDEPINVHGWSLLYYACFYRQTQIVEYMIQELYANVNHLDRFGNTVLHWACHHTQIRPNQEHFHILVKILLEYSPSFLLQCNYNNELPLHWACRYGNFDVVVFMVEYCIQRRGGGTMRETATSDSKYSAHSVELVLKLLRKADATNYTPCDIATNHKHWDIVQYLTDMQTSMEQHQEQQQVAVIG